jgi:hypothetical protein
VEVTASKHTLVCAQGFLRTSLRAMMTYQTLGKDAEGNMEFGKVTYGPRKAHEVTVLGSLLRK